MQESRRTSHKNWHINGGARIPELHRMSDHELAIYTRQERIEILQGSLSRVLEIKISQAIEIDVGCCVQEGLVVCFSDSRDVPVAGYIVKRT